MKLNSSDKSEYNLYKYICSMALDEELTECDKIITESAKIIKDLGIRRNFDSYFYIFCYLLSKGYFSYNHKFLYGIPSIGVPSASGLNILHGKGVCKDISSFMKDVFNDENLGYKTYLASTHRDKVPKNNIDLRLGIDRDSIAVINNSPKREFNHMEVLTKVDDDYRLYDPTNLAVSLFDLSVHSNVKNTMDITSIHVFNTISKKKMLNLNRELKFKRISYIHNNPEYDFIKSNAITECERHTDMLEDFNNEIHKYMVLK